MRRYALLTIFLLASLLAGCAKETATIVPTSTAVPSPEPIQVQASPVAGQETLASQAICAASPFVPQVEPRIPPITDDDHAHGPADAAITFIEYADFQCPACAALAPLRSYLEEAYGDTVRFAYRHLPLTGIHDKAVITAEAAEAAGAQGKFWEMHDLLYERQQDWTYLSVEEMPAVLVEYAGELELDVEQFEQELSDHTYRDEILADYEVYSEYGRLATPTYVANNTFYPDWSLHPFVVDAFIQMVMDLPQQFDQPEQVIDSQKQYQAVIKTNKGDIVVDLFAEQAPVNVNSFAFLAQEGWYDGLPFFLVEPEVAAHSGDPTNTGASLIGADVAWPGYACGDEFSEDISFDEAGVLALLQSGPDRNNGQFFITYAPLPELTGSYTIIGRIAEGMDVFESLTPTQPGTDPSELDSIDTILIEEQ